MSWFDQIVQAAWEDAKTPLDSYYDKVTGEQWRTMPVQLYELYDLSLQPVYCRLCGNNTWVKENEQVFVCEHEPIVGASFACRQLDSVKVSQVGHVRPGGVLNV